VTSPAPAAQHAAPEKKKSHLKTALKICVSLALMVYFLQHAGLDQTLAKLSSANLWFIPVGVGLYLLSQFVSAYRWQFLAKALQFRLALREFYDYYLMGMFFSLFLPGSIGGDVVRMFYLAKRCNRKKRESLLTLLAERGVGLVAVLLMTCVVCLTPDAAPLPWAVRLPVIAMSAMAVLGFITLRVVPIYKLAQRFPALDVLVQAEVYWRDVPLLARSVGISLVIQAVMISVQYGIAQALGMDVPLLYLIAVYGIVGLISVIPISFNGIGVREGAYMNLFKFAGVAPETGLAFALYWFLISALTSLVGGIILVKGHYKTPDMDEEPGESALQVPPDRDPLDRSVVGSAP
jgi:uncharacterized membrane protein YbhN (UPF0104 family)